jgi:hypothetical protein
VLEGHHCYLRPKNGIIPAALWARYHAPIGRSVTDFRPLSWSLSERSESRAPCGRLVPVVIDPERHFASTNYRTANGLLDHLVGDGEHRWRHLDAKCSRRLQVDHELEFG